MQTIIIRAPSIPVRRSSTSCARRSFGGDLKT